MSNSTSKPAKSAALGRRSLASRISTLVSQSQLIAEDGKLIVGTILLLSENPQAVRSDVLPRTLRKV